MAIGKYPEVGIINHVHTAGNSSGIVDGASAILIGSNQKGKDLGLIPKAKIISVATVSTDPTIMLTGPGPASKKALKQAGMQIIDIDLIEARTTELLDYGFSSSPIPESARNNIFMH